MQTPFADSEVSRGGSFVPADGPINRGGTPLTDVDACPAFHVVYNPKRFTIMAGRVIPQFGRLPHISGVNGCDQVLDKLTGAEKQVRTGAAKSDAAERGHIVIPFDAIPDADQSIHGAPGTPKSYLWCPTGRPDVHLLIYTRCYPGSKQLDVDVPRYLAWIEWLEEKGIIPRVPAHVLRAMLAKRTEEHARLADKAQTLPSYRPLVEQAAADIRVIEAELREREEAQPPTAPATGGSFVPETDDVPPPVVRRK